MSSDRYSEEFSEMTEAQNDISDQAIHDSSITFIDHTSYFNCEPACSNTPLLDRIRKAYSTLCLVRKSCEINGMTHAQMEAQRRNEIMAVLPAKYTDIMPYSNIFFVGAMDFAKSSFDNFTKMSAETRHSLVLSNVQLLQCLDGAYTSLKNFPNECSFMASYTTFVNDESLVQLFSGCPEDYEKEEVVGKFRQNMEVIKTMKIQFREVKPSIEEFIAIFGLALWNGYTANLSREAACIVRSNRKEILLELLTVYSRDGNTKYATKMVEVFGLLVNTFREIQKPFRM